MSAPYSLVNRRLETITTLSPDDSLETALCRSYREARGTDQIFVHGDNIDLDNADGLSDDERDDLDMAGL